MITVCRDCQLNAAYCDEVVRIEDKVARVKEERRQVALYALSCILWHEKYYLLLLQLYALMLSVGQWGRVV